MADRQVESEGRGKGQRGVEVVIGEARKREPGRIVGAPGHANLPIVTIWWVITTSRIVPGDSPTGLWNEVPLRD